MDNDDESLLTPTPNHFLLSTYKGNFSDNLEETKMNENQKIIFAYKCCLCRKIRENPKLTCATCINQGQFCSSKHDRYSIEQRNIIMSLFDKNDYDEFQHYSIHKSPRLSCSDRIFLLKKLNLEKSSFESKYQIKAKSFVELNQIPGEIRLRKSRVNFINHKIQKLREQIEQQKQNNIQIQERIKETRLRTEEIQTKFNEIKEIVLSSYEEKRKRLHIRAKQDKNLEYVRRERFQELLTYLFPIQRIAVNEGAHQSRLEALLKAQQELSDDETDNDTIVNNETSTIVEDRYQILKSCLPTTGDYQVENLVSIYNKDINSNEIHEHTTDLDSPQISPVGQTYEILSGLSHACQLINVIAFYLHINLPFRLHQLEFNSDNLRIDCLRADIAKLNANIITCCLSQGIPIEFQNVTHTLENLLKLLTFQKYITRPQPVIYSQNYIDILENDVNEISRTFVTDYWFDDDQNTNDEKDIGDILNSNEWEAVPESDFFDEQYDYDNSGSSPSTSSQQRSSIMSSSIDFFKSFVRNFKS